MFRVYVGNLNPEVDEGTLRGLFEERGVQTGNILVKRKYAFVDCPDQDNVDRAIESLNGYNLMGSNMQVEPSMSRRRRSNKLQVKNLPHLSRDELESFLGSFANLEKVEQAGAEGLVYVQYSNADEAQIAYNHINGYDWSGTLLKADFASNRTRKTLREPNISNSGGSGGGSGGGGSGGPNRQVEMPLRILVGSEFIGAIIGKQGQTIHNITSQTKARVDIHRRDGQAVSTETPITIKGSPESCSEACKEMMTIVQTEAQKYNKGDYPFKILCPNHLCGRIIGKQGNVIKNFMDKTNTHIVVSSAGGGQGVADANNMYVDRVVTVTGSVENASQAESLLSDKMRRCFDQDQHGYMGQISMFGGMPPMAPGMMPGFSNYQGVRPPFGHYPPPMQQEGYYPGSMGYGGNAPMPPPELEVTYLYVPENTVGSIIGSKGANIKDISKSTGARVKIIQPSAKESNGERNGQNIQERRCIITGSPEAQFQAHFQIFDRIKKEGGFSRMEDVHLRSEIMVPKGMIGRIIGKGGQNVREIQRVSGAIVNLPELNNQNPSEDGEVAVSIIGHFQAMQAAQRRVRQLVSNSSIPPKRRPSQREQNGKQQM